MIGVWGCLLSVVAPAKLVPRLASTGMYTTVSQVLQIHLVYKTFFGDTCHAANRHHTLGGIPKSALAAASYRIVRQ